VSLSRRGFLAGLASVALVGCGRKTDRPVAGGFLDDGGALGHRLRGGARGGSPSADRAAARRVERVPVIVVGGGIAGLSAAWHMERRSFQDYLVLEMEGQAGGNARSGENDVSAFPLAAHYVPVPGPDSAPLTRELFEELGVLRDGVWDEATLVHSPEYRVFRWGRWLPGLEETLAETAAEQRDFARFQEHVRELRSTGEFTIPSAGGRPSSSPLDTLSLDAWLRREGYGAPSFLWYADYACRDDYGASSRDTSAWAGVHYFASRPDEELGPLAWPEGNGWVVRRLLERLGHRVRTGQMVLRVEAADSGARVITADADYLCDAVVWAAPSFVARFVVEGAPEVDFDYSPWLTANLTLDRPPRETGTPLAWDNVLHDSPSLGYVVADHQTLRTHRERSVWTWYLAMSDLPPREARALLVGRSWGEWRDFILADLARAHPDIRECVSRIDVFRMGHAMPRPSPGFLASGARRRLGAADGPVYYANSDVEGLSLFEEAQHRGVEVARRVLARVGGE